MKNPLLRQYSHFQVMSEDNIEIRNIGEYLDVVIHTMIAHQRGPECKVNHARISGWGWRVYQGVVSRQTQDVESMLD